MSLGHFMLRRLLVGLKEEGKVSVVSFELEIYVLHTSKLGDILSSK